MKLYTLRDVVQELGVSPQTARKLARGRFGQMAGQTLVFTAIEIAALRALLAERPGYTARGVREPQTVGPELAAQIKAQAAAGARHTRLARYYGLSREMVMAVIVSELPAAPLDEAVHAALTARGGVPHARLDAGTDLSSLTIQEQNVTRRVLIEGQLPSRVAHDLYISRQRVSQLIKSALAKLHAGAVDNPAPTG